MNLTSILKKTMMAISGLAWFGFTIGHLSGNFLLFKGEKAFNDYAAFLASTGALLYLAEIGLIALLLGHVFGALKVTDENRKARPVEYLRYNSGGKKSFASRTMIYGGWLLLIFIVVHIKMFKFGDHGGEGGLFGLVMRSFQNPLITGFYVVAMLALGLHLSHGISSAAQTLGVAKPNWRPKLKAGGVAVGWLIALGFISLPVWAFLTAKN